MFMLWIVLKLASLILAAANLFIVVDYILPSPDGKKAENNPLRVFISLISGFFCCYLFVL